jgi:hypothetical protein
MPAKSPEALERKRRQRKAARAGKSKKKTSMVPGAGANTDMKIRIMRGAATRANYRFGMGGLEKSGGHRAAPITLPKMPWDKS